MKLKFRNLAVILLASSTLAACSCGNSLSSSGSAGSDSSDYAPGTSAINEQLRNTAGDRVFFALNKYHVSQEARATLDKQVEFMKNNPGLKFIIEGHCDERGTREYNIALGERRANAVKHYILSKGIDQDRLGVVSFGKEKPANEGHDEAAWAQNRRSVTVVVSN